MARAYAFRPPYPPPLFTTLAGLIADRPRAVLDLGCGPGDLARELLPVADRVDAVDVSGAMIECGRTREAGGDPRLRWIHARAEDASLSPPYALVTAGDSLHWMDWPVVLPRIREVLSANGYLALVGRNWGTATQEEREIVARYSTNKGFRPLNLVKELEDRGLFRAVGRQGFSSEWHPTIDEYIGASRSRSSYPLDAGQARAFEREIRALMERLVREGRIEAAGDRLVFKVDSGAVWGDVS